MTDQIEDGKIVCLIDNARVDSVQIHIKNNHPDWTIEKYREKWPEAPLLSKRAEAALALRAKQNKEEQAKVAAAATTLVAFERKALADVFGFGAAKAAKNARGEPIMVKVLRETSAENNLLIPRVDNNYVFDIENVKTVIIGLELNMPVLAWGMHGTGKTTMFEQICARTGRPFMRVQHTVNTEESHILGQYVVKTTMVDKKVLKHATIGTPEKPGETSEEWITVQEPMTTTEFQLGPLPLAMLNGQIYCADEYDFAMPSVLSVYQPVLEGKDLVIKDAPPEYRVIRPHPNFRFVATGNTNGGGDETGLYQGTQIQNAANYSRFGITIEVGYMEPKIETTVIANQAGIDSSDAEKLVSFGREVRNAFANGKLSTTISPRELITAARIGMVRGSAWRRGLRDAFMSRLNRTDREVADMFSQRLFGSE